MKYFGWLIIFILLILTVIPVHSQEEYREFYSQTIRTTNTGMYTLGGWAIANIASGAYGWYAFDGERKYFHQMNLFWNTVNLSIAGYSLYSNFILDISEMGAEEIFEKHTRTEKILIINAALDIGYIGAGLLMRHLAGRSDKNSELITGYGNSIILQGSFLFLFDIVLYGVLRTQRHEFFENFNIALSPDFASIRVTIPI